MIADYDAATNTIVLHTALSEKDLAKQVPGASWHERMPNLHTRQNGAWALPASWIAYCAVNGIFQHTLNPTDQYRWWAEELWKTRIGPLTDARFLTDAYIGEGPIAKRLWPLQRVATQAMVWAERYLVLDEMGGGKTVTTLAALKLAAAVHGEAAVFPVLVVTPNKVRRSWKRIALEEMGTQDNPLGPLWPDLRMEILPKGKPAQKKVLEQFTEVKHRAEGEDCAPEICGGTSYDPCGRAWRGADVLVAN